MIIIILTTFRETQRSATLAKIGQRTKTVMPADYYGYYLNNKTPVVDVVIRRILLLLAEIGRRRRTAVVAFCPLICLPRVNFSLRTMPN